MFTRVKMSAEEEINRSVYARVVRLRTEKGNKRKIVYDARRSIEEAVNKISGEYYLYSADVNYFGIRKIINSHRIRDLFHLFRILLWHELHVQMRLSNGSKMPGCDTKLSWVYVKCSELLKVLQTDLILAKFEQICLLNMH